MPNAKLEDFLEIEILKEGRQQKEFIQILNKEKLNNLLVLLEDYLNSTSGPAISEGKIISFARQNGYSRELKAADNRIDWISFYLKGKNITISGEQKYILEEFDKPFTYCCSEHFNYLSLNVTVEQIRYEIRLFKKIDGFENIDFRFEIKKSNL